MTLSKASVSPSVTGDKHLLGHVVGTGYPLATASFLPPGPPAPLPMGLASASSRRSLGPATALSSLERDRHANCALVAWHTAGAADFCTQQGVTLSCHLYFIQGRGGEDGEEDKGRDGEEAGAERWGVGEVKGDQGRTERRKKAAGTVSPWRFRCLGGSRLPCSQCLYVMHLTQPHGCPDCLSRKFLLHI